MAIIYDATLTPGKLELLRAWLPTQPWFSGDAGDVQKIGTFRFDDPAGEVGMETFLLRTSQGAIVQVPLTYRGEPLPGGEPALVGTTEHSVLGSRWVYDGCGDPVYAAALVTVVLTGGHQVVEDVQQDDGTFAPRQASVAVQGSGDPSADAGEIGSASYRHDGAVTVVEAGPYRVRIVRVVGSTLDDDQTLTGHWDGGAGVLAGVSPRR